MVEGFLLQPPLHCCNLCKPCACLPDLIFMAVKLVILLCWLVIILVMVDNVWRLRYCWWWWWSLQSPPHFYTLCKPCASLTFVFMADQAPSTAGLVAPLLFIDPEVVTHLSFDMSYILNNLKYKLFSTLWELTPKIAPMLFLHLVLPMELQRVQHIGGPWCTPVPQCTLALVSCPTRLSFQHPIMKN